MKVRVAAIAVIAILAALGFMLVNRSKSKPATVIVATPTTEPTPPLAGQTDIATGTAVLAATTMPTSEPSMTPKPITGPPAMQIDVNKTYTATIKTSEGNIVVTLAAKETPKTVNNFVALAKNKFYNNTIFHRVIKGFMIQGGDPKGDGTGGPGYQFADEPFTGSYTRGTIAMANAGPNTNGSQFFIMHADYDLPKNYVIYGKVSQGLEVVDKIATAPVSMSPSGEGSKPVTPVTVSSIEITEQ